MPRFAGGWTVHASRPALAGLPFPSMKKKQRRPTHPPAAHIQESVSTLRDAAKDEVRLIRSRAYQLTLLGRRRPVLFVGRRRGGAMLACIAWDELLEIHDLVNRAVAEGAELPEGQNVQLGVSYSPMD
jgi:hypothetical protein